MPRPRRFFPPEYKAEVVELIRSADKTVGQVARELDLTETAVREWVKGLVVKPGISRRYHAPPEALRTITALLVLRTRSSGRSSPVS
jgi:transposase-like protein